jgi:hypothetical protein
MMKSNPKIMITLLIMMCFSLNSVWAVNFEEKYIPHDPYGNWSAYKCMYSQLEGHREGFTLREYTDIIYLPSQMKSVLTNDEAVKYWLRYSSNSNSELTYQFKGCEKLVSSKFWCHEFKVDDVGRFIENVNHTRKDANPITAYNIRSARLDFKKRFSPFQPESEVKTTIMCRP